MPSTRSLVRAVSTLVTALWFAASATALAAQEVAGQPSGRIVGRIVDAGQGAPIAGAQVEVLGTTVRALSAVDGRYVLHRVPAGPVNLSVRMIGYQPKQVQGLVVPAGGGVEQNVSLAQATVQVEEIAVTAEVERGSVASAIEEQRNATNIVNSITTEQIEKAPDSDAAQAVQRVAGVSVQDGKYVFVRGLGERYTTTALNGSRMPSPEPERKLVPLDLFPSSLLEGISTSKTFTADQPGDFSGGQVNLRTREFPARRVITFSVSGGYNTASTFQNVMAAPRTGGELVGSSLSDRALPDPVSAAGDLSGLSQAEINGLINSFRDVWSAEKQTGLPNGGFGVSIGGEDPVFGQPIGYLGSFNYSLTPNIRTEETRSLVRTVGTGQVEGYNVYSGETSGSSVLWGGLLNLSARLGSSSKISLNNSLTRSADNEGVILTGENEEFSQFNPLYVTRLQYIQRSVRSNQLVGEHLFGARHHIDWRIANSRVTRDEPDRADIAYTATSTPDGLEPSQWPGQPRFATRTFSDLKETSWDGGLDYRLALRPQGDPIFVKVGTAFRSTDRESNTRAYDIFNLTLPQGELSRPPEELFSEDRINAGSFGLRANANGGRYTADEKIYAGYGMVDVPLGANLRVITGARVERWELDVNSISTTGTVAPARPRNTDVLPSIAINYALRSDMTLRLSATQTLSRPEYRELSPVPYFEQIGLFTTFGNPDLKRALVRNVDARWEFYPAAGEILSLGVFGKFFQDPIEKVIVLQAGAQAFSFVNADAATNYGVEAEVRKNLFADADGYSPLTVFSNVTLMSSDITPGNDSVSALTSDNRPMVGASAYVINAGASIAPWASGANLNLLYNVQGRRIAEAGSGGQPDAYEEARHLIDATLQVPLGARMGLKLEGKNLLNAPYRVTQGDVVRTRYKTGTTFGFSVNWEL